MARAGARNCLRRGRTHLFSRWVAGNLPRGEQPGTMSELRRRITIGLGLLTLHAAISAALSQNVVDRSPGPAVIGPVPLQATFADEVVHELRKPNLSAPTTVEAQRTAAKLE